MGTFPKLVNTLPNDARSGYVDMLREANMVAHHLARAASANGEFWVWLEEILEAFVRYVCQDLVLSLFFFFLYYTTIGRVNNALNYKNSCLELDLLI